MMTAREDKSTASTWGGSRRIQCDEFAKEQSKMIIIIIIIWSLFAKMYASLHFVSAYLDSAAENNDRGTQ